MNTNEVAKKISEAIGCDLTTAGHMSDQLMKIHEELHPVVVAWLNGVEIGYEFEGVTLDMIMKKENAKYIQAIFSMNTLLNNPKFVPIYSKMEFVSDDLEG